PTGQFGFAADRFLELFHHFSAPGEGGDHRTDKLALGGEVHRLRRAAVPTDRNLSGQTPFVQRLHEPDRRFVVRGPNALSARVGGEAGLADSLTFGGAEFFRALAVDELHAWGFGDDFFRAGGHFGDEVDPGGTFDLEDVALAAHRFDHR